MQVIRVCDNEKKNALTFPSLSNKMPKMKIASINAVYYTKISNKNNELSAESVTVAMMTATRTRPQRSPR